MEKYEKVLYKKRHIIYYNFIGGVAWGVGITLGIAFLVVILGMIGKYVNLVPVVGGFTSEVINYILATNPNL